MSSRKTLGQWLDERGVTAKPRLTLADQVQQAGGSGRQRVGPAISGRGPGTGSDLAAAAANAARLAGLGKPTAAIARSRALTLVSGSNWLVCFQRSVQANITVCQHVAWAVASCILWQR